MAAGLSVDLDRWRREFDELMLLVGAGFARVEPRRRMASFVYGLLAGLPRVNCWSIAEHAGEGCPRGMQRLLSAAVWDEAGVRDDLRGYVLEHSPTQGQCWWWTRPGTLRRGPRWVPSASTPEPPGGRRTPRSRCTWPMPPRPGPRSSTGPCTAPVLDVRPGGRVRGRQGAGRPGRAPGPHLGLLAPVDHPGPARPRVLVRPGRQPAPDRAPEDQLIPLTRHEIRRLFTSLSQQLPEPRTQLHWSRWRRRHQATARACHYRRRALTPA